MEIHGSVVENYLIDTSQADTSEIFTSSDTVNELIKGFSDQNFDNKSQDLDETTTVLPSFTKVLTSFSHQGIVTRFFLLIK